MSDSQPQPPELKAAERLIGAWEIEATHVGLPGAFIKGQVTFEWLEGRTFLIQRSRYDHPEIPDAIAITGVTDGRLSMHYFDVRGVHRVLAVSINERQWRFWGDVGPFHQRFTGKLSQNGDTIEGQSQLSHDGTNWEDDLTITYRRAADTRPAQQRP
ncbi:hypothetical protein J4573_32700 [Actinomadura barringtoniae]|uniref:DUF1579 domain-containing protein n=1 Tax=Actinomadura barringtoniae TaxID=1427535 RepID=A0A939PFV6_9ACTN|nr:hypothetical protein [Actinomadura barringtoniae]MBO2451886.1 hypothetical protein [Actinomadura barringtoniae]